MLITSIAVSYLYLKLVSTDKILLLWNVVSLDSADLIIYSKLLDQKVDVQLIRYVPFTYIIILIFYHPSIHISMYNCIQNIGYYVSILNTSCFIFLQIKKDWSNFYHLMILCQLYQPHSKHSNNFSSGGTWTNDTSPALNHCAAVLLWRINL